MFLSVSVWLSLKCSCMTFAKKTPERWRLKNDFVESSSKGTLLSSNKINLVFFTFSYWVSKIMDGRLDNRLKANAIFSPCFPLSPNSCTSFQSVAPVLSMSWNKNWKSKGILEQKCFWQPNPMSFKPRHTPKGPIVLKNVGLVSSVNQLNHFQFVFNAKLILTAAFFLFNR